MRATNNEKRQNALELLIEINKCEIESDCSIVSDKLEEFVEYGLIFKKDYRALSRKLDSQCCYLVERGYI